MSKILWSLLTALFIVLNVDAHNSAQSPSKELDEQLRAVSAADQGVREEVMRLYSRQPVAQDSLMAAFDRQRRVDSLNQRFVFGLLDKGGWPEGLSVEANEGVWYVIQHASPEEIESYLPMIRSAASKGLIERADYALTIDRVRMHDNLPQIYGSQTLSVDVNGDRGTLWLWPVEDAERLDSLRTTVGLPPIADYLKAVEAACGRPVVWDRTKTAVDMAGMRGW